jgi:hypothetical protein
LKGKRFGDRSPGEKALIGLIFLVSLVVVSFAEQDIQRRDGAEIRGPKLAWRIVSLNALGALTYLARGRR